MDQGYHVAKHLGRNRDRNRSDKYSNEHEFGTLGTIYFLLKVKVKPKPSLYSPISVSEVGVGIFAWARYACNSRKLFFLSLVKVPLLPTVPFRTLKYLFNNHRGHIYKFLS